MLKLDQSIQFIIVITFKEILLNFTKFPITINCIMSKPKELSKYNKLILTFDILSWTSSPKSGCLFGPKSTDQHFYEFVRESHHMDGIFPIY